MTTDPATATLPRVAADLPGSLGEAVAEMGDRVRVHDLYDEHGARAYDDSTHLHPSEIRVLRRVLRQHPGPVLELAAGSGRLTLPMLTMERDVTALELTGSMIDLLHENVRALPEQAQARMTVHQGDMTDFELATSFSVAVIGAASISILDAEGRAQLFHAVRRHLSPGGVLLFSIVIPLEEEDGDVDVVMDLTGRSGARYRVHEHRWAGAVERLVGVYPLDAPADGPVPVCVGTHRVLELEPVLREVVDAGLVVRAQHDFGYPLQGLTEIFIEVGEAA